MNKPKSESFIFKAGTKLSIGDHAVTLTEDSEVFFDGASAEATLVGILSISKNLDVNRGQLQKRYNSFGLEIPSEPTVEPEPSDSERNRVEEEFKRTQETQGKAANGLPIEPLDRDVVPSQQRAPVLGSPELKDVEKMNNMDQIPSFKGFAPLTSQPTGDAPQTGDQPQVNETAENTIDIGATTDRGAQNAPPNTAISEAKRAAGTAGDVPKSSIADDAPAGDEKVSSAAAEKPAGDEPAEPSKIARVRADLKAKTVPELKQIAKDLEIKLPTGSREDEIIEAIIERVGTGKAMGRLLAK